MHIQPKHARRAVGDLLGASSAAGIGDNTVVASGNGVTATGLMVDHDVTATASVSLPLVATTQAPPTPLTTNADAPVTTPAAAASKSAQPDQAAASSESGRQLGPILGITVGSLAAVALVLLAILFYLRRSSRALKSRGRAARSRNLHGEQGRRRSRLEPWARLSSGENKGHGGEWSAAGEMEKMDDMFKGGADSVRSGTTGGAHTDLSEAPQLPEMTRYHAGLAEELAGAAAEPAFPQRAYAPRAQAQDVPMSWGAETTGGDSFLTLRSTRRLSGAMSPTLGFAKQTPIVSQSPISDEHHQWQSAVVVHPAGESAVVVEDPFANPVDPFTDAQETHARAFVSHKPSASAFSDMSTAPSEHAMQSLIAALDLTPSLPNERFRTASMSPSDISAYSDAGQIVRDFPLPPPVVAGGDAQTLVRG